MPIKELNNIDKLKRNTLSTTVPIKEPLNNNHLKEINNIKRYKNIVITTDSKGSIKFWENNN